MKFLNDGPQHLQSSKKKELEQAVSLVQIEVDFCVNFNRQAKTGAYTVQNNE